MTKHYVSGEIDGYDVEGKGETWEDALRAYAQDCNDAAGRFQAHRLADLAAGNEQRP